MLHFVLFASLFAGIVVSQQEDELARKLDELDSRSLELLTRIPRNERMLHGQIRYEVFNFLLEFESARLQMLKRGQIDPMMDYKMRRILARIQAKFKTKYPVIKARLHRLFTRLFSPLLMPFVVFDPVLTEGAPAPLDSSVTAPSFTQDQNLPWFTQGAMPSQISNQFLSNAPSNTPQWNSVPFNYPDTSFYYPNINPNSQFFDNNLLYYPYRYRYRN